MTRPGFEPGLPRWEAGDYFFFIIYLVCEAIGTAATPGLLCQPRMIMKMIVEKQMECRLAGKPKFSSEKTWPSATFVHHKIPHDQTRVWTRAAAVGSRRLTAWAMSRPKYIPLMAWVLIFTSIKKFKRQAHMVGVALFQLKKFATLCMQGLLTTEVNTECPTVAHCLHRVSWKTRSVSNKKVKISPLQAVEAHRVARG
jgi:hypothetical protein